MSKCGSTQYDSNATQKTEFFAGYCSFPYIFLLHAADFVAVNFFSSNWQSRFQFLKNEKK